MAAVYTVIVYKKKKSEKCLLEIVLLTAKFQFNEKSSLIVLHYTFPIFKLKLIRIFSVTKPLWIFAACPPLTHTRAEKSHSQVPSCFALAEYQMDGPTNIEPQGWGTTTTRPKAVAICEPPFEGLYFLW